MRLSLSFPLLTFATLVGLGLTFSLQWLLVRLLEPEEFSKYVGVASAINLLCSLIALGANHYILVAAGKSPRDISNSWSNVLLYYVATAILACLVLLLIPFENFSFLTWYQRIAIFGLILGTSLLPLIWSAAQINGRLSLQALWQIVPYAIRLLSVLLMILLVSDAASAHVMLLTLSAAGWLIFLLGSLYMMKVLQLTAKLSFFATERLYSLKKIFKDTFPFGVANIFYAIYTQAAFILLPSQIDPTTIVQFFAAWTLFLASTAVFIGVSQKLFLVKIQRGIGDRKEKYIREIRLFIYQFFIIAVTSSLALYLLSDKIVQTIFGDEFKVASNILQVLSIATFFRIAGIPFDLVMTTAEYIRVKYIAYGIPATVIVLIFSTYGSALGPVELALIYSTAEAFIFAKFLFYVFTGKNFSR